MAVVAPRALVRLNSTTSLHWARAICNNAKANPLPSSSAQRNLSTSTPRLDTLTEALSYIGIEEPVPGRLHLLGLGGRNLRDTGVHMTPGHTKQPPDAVQVQTDAEPSEPCARALYSVVLLNIDIHHDDLTVTKSVGSRQCLVHWWLCNLKPAQFSDLTSVAPSNIAVEYLPCCPHPSNRKHRYLSLLLQQSDRLTFSDQQENSLHTPELLARYRSLWPKRFVRNITAFLNASHFVRQAPSAANVFEVAWDVTAAENYQRKLAQDQETAKLLQADVWSTLSGKVQLS